MGKPSSGPHIPDNDKFKKDARPWLCMIDIRTYDPITDQSVLLRRYAETEDSLGGPGSIERLIDRLDDQLVMRRFGLSSSYSWPKTRPQVSVPATSAERPVWRRTIGDYSEDELVALQFWREDQLDAALAILWGELRDMPHEPLPENTILIPHDGQRYFQQLKYSPVRYRRMASLGLEEMRRARSEE